jgi:hypothetical protein
MPPDSVRMRVLLVPQRQVLQQLFQQRRIARLAEQAAAELHRVPHRLEGIGVQLLRHQADGRARAAPVALDVVAIGEHRALTRVDDAADDADQRGLAGAIGAEQREDLAAADVEVDVVQRDMARCIGLAQPGDGDDRWHAHIVGQPAHGRIGW